MGRAAVACGLGKLSGAGPGRWRRVADLGRVDEVELLGEGIGVDGLGELVGIEADGPRAFREVRDLGEVVAQIRNAPPPPRPGTR